jgi:hypothetical protein
MNLGSILETLLTVYANPLIYRYFFVPFLVIPRRILSLQALSIFARLFRAR